MGFQCYTKKRSLNFLKGDHYLEKISIFLGKSREFPEAIITGSDSKSYQSNLQWFFFLVEEMRWEL